MTHRLILWALLAVTMAACGNADAGQQSKPKGIPLPTGNFSFAGGGSFASCLNPGGGAAESCSAPGVTVVPLNEVFSGAEIRDKSGNACGTHTAVLSSLPVGASLPTVPAVHHVIKLTNYDSTSGVGDQAITIYSGGSCNGTEFDSSGATQLLSGTLHFAVTEDGDRIENVYTSLTGAPGVFAIGGVAETVTELKQTN